MTVALSTQSYSHTFEAQLESILSQYNEIMTSDVSPFTVSNKSYNFIFLADRVYSAISQDLSSKGYQALSPIELYELTNGEAFLLSTIVRNINLSLEAGGGSSSVNLLPFGATQSVDGAFQRFTTDGTNPLGYPAYYAELYAEDWQDSPISIQFKWPNLTLENEALVLFFCNGSFNSIENPIGDESDSVFASFQIARVVDGEVSFNTGSFSVYKFGQSPTSTNLTLTPTEGSIATLAFTRTQLTLTVSGQSQTHQIPMGTFAGVTLFNVATKVENSTLPLSIRIL